MALQLLLCRNHNQAYDCQRINLVIKIKITMIKTYLTAFDVLHTSFPAPAVEVYPVILYAELQRSVHD